MFMSMESTKPRDPGLEAARAAAGSYRKIAKRIGLTPQAISRWKRIPQAHLEEVSELTGLPASVLRPDLVSLAKLISEQKADEIATCQ